MVEFWNSRSPMLKGTWLMIGSVLIFSVLLILIRLVGAGVSVFTVVVVRQVIMQAVILVVSGPHARTLLQTNNLQLQLWRSALALGSTLGIYVSFIYLPLALASAISFSAVLFVTMGAAVFLKEKVDAKTWAATIIGLIGVVIMLSPREGGDIFYILVAIAGAIVSAGTILTVRVFHPSESIGTVLTYQGVLVVPVLLVPMLLTWQMPTPTEWLLLLLIGLVSTAGHWTFVAAYRHAEAARLAPLDFLRLVLLSVAGLVFFQEHPEPTLLVGMAIVVATTFYVIRSNARNAAATLVAEKIT
jgi:drug/metabolite transporter (DMT)-like permease